MLHSKLFQFSLLLSNTSTLLVQVEKEGLILKQFMKVSLRECEFLLILKHGILDWFQGKKRKASEILLLLFALNMEP